MIIPDLQALLFMSATIILPFNLIGSIVVFLYSVAEFDRGQFAAAIKSVHTYTQAGYKVN